MVWDGELNGNVPVIQNLQVMDLHGHFLFSLVPAGLGTIDLLKKKFSHCRSEFLRISDFHSLTKKNQILKEGGATGV